MVALLLERQNRLSEARKEYERILSLEPHAIVAANNLAWIYCESGGNLDVALQLAQEATSKAPDEPDFNDTLGWIYYKKDLVFQGMPHMQRAVSRAPNNPLFRFHLGMAYAKQGESVKALASLKRALAIDPRFEAAAEARNVIQELETH